MTTTTDVTIPSTAHVAVATGISDCIIQVKSDGPVIIYVGETAPVQLDDPSQPAGLHHGIVLSGGGGLMSSIRLDMLDVMDTVFVRNLVEGDDPTEICVVILGSTTPTDVS